jgi:hypothetical protein
MDVDEVESGRGAPMSEQARFDVLEFEGFCEQRVIEKINLSDRQILRSAPVCVNPAKLIG